MRGWRRHDSGELYQNKYRGKEKERRGCGRSGLSPAIGPAGRQRYFPVPLSLCLAALLCRLQPLFESFHFAMQTFGKVVAESGEVFLDQRYFGEPAFDVDTEQFGDVRGRHV